MVIPSELSMFHWTSLIVALVGLEHLFFAILEMFFQNSNLAKKIFKTSEDSKSNREYKILLANVGIYNFCLAMGLFWSVWRLDSFEQLFFLGFVFLVGMFGAITTRRKAIFWTQAFPALIGIILILLFAQTGIIQDLL